MNKISYTAFKANLDEALDRAEKGEVICIERKGHNPIYLRAAVELSVSTDDEPKRRFNESLEKVRRRHASVIKALADK